MHAVISLPANNVHATYQFNIVHLFEKLYLHRARFNDYNIAQICLPDDCARKTMFPLAYLIDWEINGSDSFFLNYVLGDQ